MTRAPLESLAARLALAPSFGTLSSFDVATVAVSDPARPFVLAGLAAHSHARVILVAVATIPEADRLSHDLEAFISPERVELFPAWETLPFERVSPSVETMGRRVRVLWRIHQAQTDPPPTLALDSTPSLIVVAPIKALLQRVALSPERAAPLRIEIGQRFEPDELVTSLVEAGYRREYQVEHRGEFAVRGGIIDVFPSTGAVGVRVDCFGDDVERLTEFDVADQRSVADLDEVEIYACRELALTDAVRARAGELSRSGAFGREQFARIAEGEAFDGVESFLPWVTDHEVLLPDLLSESDRVLLAEPRRMRDRAFELIDEEESLATSLAKTWGVEATGDDQSPVFPRLHLDYGRVLDKTTARTVSLVAVAEGPGTETMPSGGWPRAFGEISLIASRLSELVRRGSTVVVAADSVPSATRMAAGLEAEGIVVDRQIDTGEPRRLTDPGVHVVVARLDQGFVLDAAGVAVLAEADVTGRRRPHRVPRARARAVEGFFDDLALGSFVVHNVHGVARYGGMVRRAIGGSERDYLVLEYRGDDRLYIPSDQIDVLTPYSGGESPTLSRLNGNEWQRQRARVRQAATEIAQELVVLYQRRLSTDGFAFSADTPWQVELEQAFPYPETVDQLRAINDVKADMERPIPMDRLVCGDVGFGKTEVALRAVFKAIQDNKQAALLVPTTLLAQQHFQTLQERFAPYPVRVEMLSRFLTPAQARAVTAGLSDGSVDVVVGTHALLASGVSFRNLGLLVVDEEQRFGVGHKEEIKKLQVGVDVLTLTASPIPRTLEMGLTGIRDLSVIDTPPSERQPILTYVGELDERAIAEALRRELLREGQVFFVHNRVRDIERVAAELGVLVPEARIAIAHGQMDEGTLEKVVLDFSEGRFDVLVCTTIIESGIDMPTVNTLVVDRADLLGLGQLHQLRGRVGRAGQRAYAYLFHPTDRVLPEQAYERLRTIGENTELGSGFKIAMRDLEIRGAGNLLGRDQSGHIAAVGYDLYVRMVAEAVAELKGETVPEPAEVKLDLPVDANLPASYVEREDLRLEAYRRLAGVRSNDAVDDIKSEWIDRFGPLPGPAEALLSVARLRAACVARQFREVTGVAVRPGAPGPGRLGEVVVRIAPITLRASSKVRLSRLYPRALLKEDVAQLVVPLPAKELAPSLLDLLEGLVPLAEPSA